MAYKNARDILPACLLREIQKYAQGELLYIPSDSDKKSWGTRNGARYQYEERNNHIRRLYLEQMSMEQLADQFCLSIDSIRKIIHTS